MILTQLFRGFAPIAASFDRKMFGWATQFLPTSSHQLVGVSYHGEADGRTHFIMPFGDAIGTLEDHRDAFGREREQTVIIRVRDAFESTEVVVGLTNSFLFGGGRSVEGIFYGVNLGTNEKTLVDFYGAPVGSGDTIKLITRYELDFKDEYRLKVIILHNSMLLGQAFDIPANDLPFYAPVIGFNGPGSILAWVRGGYNTTSSLLPSATRRVSHPSPSGLYWLNSTALTLSHEQMKASKLIVFERRGTIRHLTVQMTYTTLTKVFRADPPGPFWRFAGAFDSVGSSQDDTKFGEDTYALADMLSRTAAVLRYHPVSGGSDELHLFIGRHLHSTWVRINAVPKTFVGNPFAEWQKNHPQAHEDMKRSARVATSWIGDMMSPHRQFYNQ